MRAIWHRQDMGTDRMSDFWRAFLRLFIPGSLIIVLGAWFIIDSEHQHRLDELKAEQRLAVSLGAQSLTRHVHMVASDLEYLIRSASLRDLTAAPTPENKMRLARDFSNFSRARSVYDQIRWIDAEGQEIVRVDQERGEPRVVPAAELQNKRDRYYFSDAIRGRTGEVFLSRLDLNIERGVIEHPFKPMLRLAAPLKDAQGNTRGIIVLNYQANEMLRRFESVTHRFGNQIGLLDGAGYWLHAPDPADEWGFMFADTTRSLPHRSPEVWRQFMSEEGQFEYAGSLWTYAVANPLTVEEGPLSGMGTDAQAYRWIATSQVTPEQMQAILPGHRVRIWAAILGLVALLACGCALIVRHQKREYARELRYQAIFDNAMIGMATLSPDNRLLTVNPALSRILGYDSPTLLGTPLTTLIHPDDAGKIHADIDLMLNGQQDQACLQVCFVDARSNPVFVDVAAHLVRRTDKTPDYFVLIIEDVNARRIAEQKNRLFSQRAAALLELPKAAETMDEHAFMHYAIEQVEQLTESQIGFIHLLNDDGKSIELLSWSSSTLTNSCNADFIHHYPLADADIWADAVRHHAPVLVNDDTQTANPHILPDGHAHLARFICVPIIENGKVSMILGTGNRATPYETADVETTQLIGNETWRIVQRKRSDHALFAASQVVTASPIVCFRWQASDGWPVVFVSDNVRQWGYAPEDLIAGNPPFADLVHPDDLPRVSDEVLKRTAAGEMNYEQEYRLLTRNGAAIWVVDRTRVVRDEQGRVKWYDGVLTDISERKQRQTELSAALAEQRKLNKRLEEANNQLLQSEKMASIGQLAAGVAHELNNPIGFVHSNLGTLDAYLNDLMSMIDAYQHLSTCHAAGTPELDGIEHLKTQLDFDYLRSDIFQLVAESKDGLARVKKIVMDLKNFSRVGEQDWQLASLHEGLDSTLNIVWNELKYKCEVIKDYGEIPPVYCLISQLNQVFMNLLVNAGHAIEAHGTISIRTRLQNPEQVCVEISDTGTGIPKDNLTRIFDPFFTTKPIGKGTGLGLSLAYGIIDRHHGQIEVDSEVGVGTTFRIILPINQSEAQTTDLKEIH